jgi:hypothetical protein
MDNVYENYDKLLSKFYNDIKDFGDIGIYGLFLPNVMENYFTSSKKYFYMGRDTYYWKDYKDMLDLLKNQNYDDYIKLNNEWLSPKSIIEYSNNSAGAFWTTIIKLHLKLNHYNLQNVNDITEEETNCLRSLGWGNLNSIEVPQSLEKEVDWDVIDKDKYWKIKDASKSFDKIKLIIDTFQPDYIFIFNWCDSDKENEVFESLNPIWNKDEYIENVISTYNFKEYKTKIIWCPHPARFSYISYNNDQIIEEIMKRI